ncbi:MULTISPECIES: RecQ family ATP-dependent DNA helicase [Bacillus]|uniref:RecQ family ATP-dependent DNA helicase n=1 Tax=Bacillus TaxID=1386 RepID=UPI00077D8453|nr:MULTISPECIES: ATP-dependent DNA helicase RecQ [Bacillus]AMQ74572.1 ATP-dependent DNA helicase RecS [Bacillus amyloliquefaciens UMAF6614]AWM48407.1 ATP-dependent DNA helicase RecQ [Bacillus amyloliquefaciens]MBF6664954.1 ATP-dependent DNA helicase RecQ [Bacillus velezensis]MDH3081710.1 ATP-dependent DNA helicase [Bacillus amyloliquefaciens]MDU0076099.1 ATP-dependent DNA helicase RecQ [Bacillus sp. IG2]
MTELHKALSRYFGLHSFKKGQEEIMTSVLQKKDTIAMLPTGGGKSLCYQLPGYMMDGLVLIISPLLSLMEDQVQQLKAKGEKRVAALNSMLNSAERHFILSNISRYKFLYMSPEALSSPYVLNRLKNVPVSLFVIDEAHCISEWGHDFRPDYSKLGPFRQALGKPPVLALTATATKETLRDVTDVLGLEHAVRHLYSVNRPNILLAAEHLADNAEKISRLTELAEKLEGPGIIYCPTRKWAEELAAELNEKTGKRTDYYHGGMDTGDRILIQQQFIHNQLDCICCTNAFGMGVDKSDIRFVIHFYPPQTAEAFMQEIGRAGRDGSPSVSILLRAPGDTELQQQIIQTESLSDYDLEAILAVIRDAGTGDERKLRDVLINKGVQETQARTAVHLYLQGKTTKEQLQEELTYRVEKKLRKMNRFSALLERKECIREALLSYFDEPYEPVGQTGQCCSSCGLDLAPYEQKGERKNMERFEDWKLELGRIFGSESAGEFS